MCPFWCVVWEIVSDSRADIYQMNKKIISCLFLAFACEPVSIIIQGFLIVC